MASRAALITQADATRWLKAAKSAGFQRARILARRDGTVELIAEGEKPVADTADPNEWDEALK